jgi:hypothetical protein
MMFKRYQIEFFFCFWYVNKYKPNLLNCSKTIRGTFEFMQYIHKLFSHIQIHIELDVFDNYCTVSI